MNMNVTTIEARDATPINAARVDTSKGTTIMDASMNWMRRPADERFLSLDAMFEHAKRQSDASREQVMAVSNVEFITPPMQTRDDFNKLAVGLNVGNGFEGFNFSHWSFGQIAALAGNAPASYLRTLPSPIVADALKYGLLNNRSNPEAKFYTSGKTLLSATGPLYGRIPNYQIVEAIRALAGDGVSDDAAWRVPGKMSWANMMYDPFHPVTSDTTTLFMSDRDMFVFLTDPHRPIVVGKTRDGQDDVMYRGFIVSQSEVGKSSLWVKAFLFRGVCENRIIWGADNIETVRIAHTKTAPERWLRQVEPALVEYAKSSEATIVNAVNNAKAKQIAEDDDRVELETLGGKFFGLAA